LPDIQYLGHSCIRLRGRDGIVICDPFDRSVGLDIGRPTAHIVTVSQNHPAHTNTSVVKPMRDETFLINGPGEYEVRGVLITGVRTSQSNPETTLPYGHNTAYVIYLDEIAFCHLGNVSQELTQQQLEEIGNVDVLFVPVGGGHTIGPAAAVGMISQIEPRLVIPMRYAHNQISLEEPLEPLDKFIHEVGMKEVTPEEKVTITSSNLPGENEQTRFMVMVPGSS
jgi:L-ascorbate metabolism protein UlaG (beta-lactamase superfamily)